MISPAPAVRDPAAGGEATSSNGRSRIAARPCGIVTTAARCSRAAQPQAAEADPIRGSELVFFHDRPLSLRHLVALHHVLVQDFHLPPCCRTSGIGSGRGPFDGGGGNPTCSRASTAGTSSTGNPDEPERNPSLPDRTPLEREGRRCVGRLLRGACPHSSPSSDRLESATNVPPVAGILSNTRIARWIQPARLRRNLSPAAGTGPFRRA